MNKSMLVSVAASMFLLQVQAPHAKAEDSSQAKCHAEYAVTWTPLIAKTSGTPWLFRGSEGKYHLTYELLLTNFMSFDSTLNMIEVIDADHPEKVLLNLDGESLKKVLLILGAKEPTGKFAAGAAGVVFVNVEFDSKKDAPARIAHRISLTSNHPADVKIPKDYLTAEAPVKSAEPPVISSPLRGERWVAGGGYNGELGHRRAIFPVSGEIKLAQRYAIDWVKMNEQNQLHVGDSSKCESYFCYGEPIYSVSDGTVCGAIDKFKDQVPLMPPTGPVSEYPGGNAITIKMSSGLYAFYAHLKPGTLLVKEGDVVKKGQQIGTLGNSGNSSEPHLHFHISDSPIVLKADSKPYLFDQFLQIGMIKDASKAFDLMDKGTASTIDAVGVGEHKLELITEGAVVNF